MQDLQTQLTALVGDSNVTYDDELPQRLGLETGPLLLASPENEPEVQALLRSAQEARAAVVPLGGGQHLGMGNLLKRQDVAICSRRMNRIIDYEPADLVVAVEPGVTLRQLGAVLSLRGQMLPVDPFASGDTTIGGLVACNLSGPRRTQYGTLRDMVIGLHVVYPDGRLIHTGGRVVKNVAGYDMTKLFIGSLGTLGFITEVVFKLRPMPLFHQTCVVSGTAQQVGELFRQLAASTLLPSRAEAVHGDAVWRSTGDWSVVLDCDEHEAANRHQAAELRRWADALGMTFETRDGASADADWQTFRDRQAETAFCIRLSMPPNCAAEVCERLRQELTDDLQETVSGSVKLWQVWSVGALVGVARLFMDGLSAQACTGVITRCRKQMRACGGTAVVERAPIDTLRAVDAFGPPPSGLSLMQGIKASIDPYGQMNPGRFVGGI